MAKHPGLELHFPPQPVAFESKAMSILEDGSPAYWDVDELDVAPRAGSSSCSRRTSGSAARCPPGSRSSRGSTPGIKRGVLAEFAQAAVDAGGVEKLDDARAQLLARAPTRFVAGGGPADGRFGDDLDDMAAWVADLDRSWLAMQGPPGTGKTYRGARVIRELVRRGRRVGITAMSHAAIHNLVAATHEAFAESDELDLLACVVKPGSDVPDELDGVTYEKDGKKCAGEDFNVVAGTTWLFASSGMRDNPVDVLVVDEAGQLALIDVIAAGVSAHNLLLLGDPQQLPQVNLAVHPGGSGASALEHVLDGRKTLPPEDGIFLDETRRMHPDVCDFIGEQFYEDRLTSHDLLRRPVDPPRHRGAVAACRPHRLLDPLAAGGRPGRRRDPSCPRRGVDRPARPGAAADPGGRAGRDPLQRPEAGDA